MGSDFKTISYNASNDPEHIRFYSTTCIGVIETAVADATTVTVTTVLPHQIILEWDNSVTYGAGVRVKRYGKIYVSQAGANINHDPVYGSPGDLTWWDVDEAIQDAYTTTAVDISGVVGMTDLNQSWTITSSPTINTFIVDCTTAQAYTSGGYAKIGIFQYRNTIDYNASSDPATVTTLYTE